MAETNGFDVAKAHRMIRFIDKIALHVTEHPRAAPKQQRCTNGKHGKTRRRGSVGTQYYRTHRIHQMVAIGLSKNSQRILSGTNDAG